MAAVALVLASAPLASATDVTPPTIAPAPDLTVEARTAAGAIVDYTAPATTDDVDPDGVATCAPASGSLFPLGDTTVHCNASDAAGNAAQETTFVVHVVDTSGPSLVAPLDLVRYTDYATQRSKALTYTVPTAIDAVSGPTTATCAPASGSVFLLGNTTVTCTATDAQGNSASVRFNVYLLFDTEGFIVMTSSFYGPTSVASGEIKGTYHIRSKSGAALKDVDVRVDVIRQSASGVASTESLFATSDAAGNFRFTPSPRAGIPDTEYVVEGVIRMTGYPPAFARTTYAVQGL